MPCSTPERLFATIAGALELDPALAVAGANRGMLSFKVGRTDDAIADFHRAPLARPDSETEGRTHYSLALAYLEKGDRGSAEARAAGSCRPGLRESRRASRDPAAAEVTERGLAWVSLPGKEANGR